MTSATHRIRHGRPEEIDELVAIDADACQLYEAHGIVFGLDPSHELARDERRRWLDSLEQGSAFVASGPDGRLLAFATLGGVDGDAYLDQLAVRLAAMRRGIGSALVREAVRWAAARGAAHLWLTTYGHLAFNRAFYERAGFVVVPESACGPDVRHHLEQQRRFLPRPDCRVAMRLAVGSLSSRCR